MPHDDVQAPVLLPAAIPTRGDPRLTDYTPVFALWSKVVDLNEEASALGYNNVVHFGPGLECSYLRSGGQLRETAITKQVADMMLEERRNSIVESIFVPCEQPLLQVPETGKTKREDWAEQDCKEGADQEEHQAAGADQLGASLQEGHPPPHQGLRGGWPSGASWGAGYGGVH